jgi:hypothetical protein
VAPKSYTNILIKQPRGFVVCESQAASLLTLPKGNTASFAADALSTVLTSDVRAIHAEKILDNTSSIIERFLLGTGTLRPPLRIVRYSLSAAVVVAIEILNQFMEHFNLNETFMKQQKFFTIMNSWLDSHPRYAIVSREKIFWYCIRICGLGGALIGDNALGAPQPTEWRVCC